MAPNRGRNRAADFDEYMQNGTRDFDPEEDIPIDDSEDESSGDEDAESAGREHYEQVGKSKLRKPKEVALGPQYRGSKVDRAVLEDGSDDEDEDDPFSKGFDDEDSEEDELVLNGGADSEDEDEDEDSADDTGETDVSDDGGNAAVAQLTKTTKDESLQKELEAIKAERQKPTAEATSQAAAMSDAEKGRAVKKQRLAFDSLLNTRMKLQKSLIATNTLVGLTSEQIAAEKGEAQQALQAAEAAAFNLWNSLNNFREDLEAARTGTKRKRSVFTSDTPTSSLWSSFEAQESASRPHRDAILKKWSHKTQAPTLQPQTSRLTQTVQTTILDVLQEQLSHPDRLLARTHTPRSMAPLQASRTQPPIPDPKIYDDADFYGLLLKELVESRAADSIQTSTIDLGFQLRRENKTKRANVDTKASKGRKLRYTVHEKLQNFMAPEEGRGSWGERQSEELFGSLFGRRVGLGEREDEDEDGMKERDEIDPKEVGILFGR